MNQLDLFWGSDPQYIIGAFQFMQLGYAIAASILLIFWDSIDVMYASVRAKHLITSLILCYLIFLWILAQVVPRYTLCISLGQLVNRRRLHETLAKYKLEEARRVSSAKNTSASKRRSSTAEKRTGSSGAVWSMTIVRSSGVIGHLSDLANPRL